MGRGARNSIRWKKDRQRKKKARGVRIAAAKGETKAENK